MLSTISCRAFVRPFRADRKWLEPFVWGTWKTPETFEAQQFRLPRVRAIGSCVSVFAVVAAQQRQSAEASPNPGLAHARWPSSPWPHAARRSERARPAQAAHD